MPSKSKEVISLSEDSFGKNFSAQLVVNYQNNFFKECFNTFL